MKIPHIYTLPTAPGSQPSSQQALYAAMSSALSQTSAAAPVPGVSATTTDTTTTTFQALADLAAIDMILRRMADGQIDPATGQAQINKYMNDLVNNCQGNAIPAINSIILSLAADFKLTNGNYVPIMSQGSSSYLNCKFEWDWDQNQGNKNTPDGWTSIGGIQQIWAALGSKPFPPNFTVGPNNPMAFCNFLLFASDSMLCPTIALKGNYDLQMFGTTYGLPQPMDFAHLIPIYVETAFYQQDVINTNNPNNFYSDMCNFLELFPNREDLSEQYQGQDIQDKIPNYLNLLGQIQNTITNPDYSVFPPKEWASILGPNYLAFFGNGGPIDLSFFYSDIENYQMQQYLNS